MIKWALIANKHAGTRSSKKFWEKMDIIFSNEGLAVEYFFTEKVGHARELAMDIVKKGYKKIAVMGGDGTFSEVIDGLMKSNVDISEVSVGLIPFGTGNDWGRYWGLDRNIEKSVKILAEGTPTLVDVGLIKYNAGERNITRYFINAYGLGFDAKVLELTNRMQHIFKGASWTYTLALFMTIFVNRSQIMEYDFGQEKFKGLSYTASIGNGCFTGGGIKQTPEARVDDGVFDVMIVENLNLVKILKAVKLLFTGRLLEHDSVHLYRTNKMTIKSEKPILSEVDGIFQEKTHYIEVELIPQKIKFITPNSSLLTPNS
ncbi:MAG: diacylglycerol kinase family lipid kinase [Paludibacteraceae bacterium]|nr:diacylglycerol kinase family lipid kinase [Paludibacteraceae bacterium]